MKKKPQTQTEVVVANDLEEMARHLKERHSFDRPSNIVVHSRQHLDTRARYVMAYLERWGLIAGIPDGEDSAGRQKLRLANSEELVTRAVSIVGEAWGQLAAKGWIFGVPPMEAFEPDDKNGSND